MNGGQVWRIFVLCLYLAAFGGVAQLAEQPAFNRQVVGSIPTAPIGTASKIAGWVAHHLPYEVACPKYVGLTWLRVPCSLPARSVSLLSEFGAHGLANLGSRQL